MKRLTLILAIILTSAMQCRIMAQKESADVRRGNRQYNKENYTEAEVDYRRGLEKNQRSFEGHFNLGDALFRQEKYPEAIEEYKNAEGYLDKSKDTRKNKSRQAAVDHNIGNAQFAQQQYGEAVESYKRSLKNNPKDDDTRYNLVKAMQMLQQQQQNQNQQQQQQQEQQQQQQQQNQNQMDKETAEQLLQALEQDEQDTQEKAKRQQAQGGKRVEKNW